MRLPGTSVSARGSFWIIIAASALPILPLNRAMAARICTSPGGGPFPPEVAAAAAEPPLLAPGERDGYRELLDLMIRNRRAVARGEMTQAEAERFGGTGFFGVLEFPVFPMLYGNTEEIPYPRINLEQQLFTGWPTGTMADYYEEVSYGGFSVGGEVLDWHQVPEDATYYKGESHGLPSASAHLDEAIASLLTHWDPEVDFSLYDNDGPDGEPNSGDDDGFADWIAVVTPESGAECPITLCPFVGEDNVWSHQSTLTRWWGSDSTFVTNDDAHGGGKIRVNRYFVNAGLDCDGTQNKIGVYCHEFGHVLGIADLVDMDRSSEGIGHWGLMGSGVWNTPTHPAHMTAWTKERLGWLFYFNVNGDMPLCLPAVELNPIAVRLWTHGAESQEYFVIENRQPEGFDSELHARGLVIYHVDEERYEQFAWKNTVNSAEAHKSIDVECSDAFTASHVVDADHLDLGRCEEGNRGDAGDVWCPDTKTTFDPNSIPDTRSYEHGATGVAVRNISSCGEGMSAEICADYEVGTILTADLCMRDCAPSGCEEISDCDVFWDTPDIWIDNNLDGLDDLPHVGAVNIFWCRIFNHGPEPVVGATLQVFTRLAGFGLRWPEAGELIYEVPLPLIPPGNFIVHKKAAFYPDTPEGVDHLCIGALVFHDLDPMNSQYPPHDNNLVQVNHQNLVERAGGGLPRGDLLEANCGSLLKTSKLQIHSGDEYYGREVEIRLGSPPNFDDWVYPEGWTFDFDPGPYLLLPGQTDSTEVVMSCPNAAHGDTAHVPLTLWDTQNEKAAGGVVLDYRIDCIVPAAPIIDTATCLEIPPDWIIGPNVLLEWDEVLLDVEAGTEVLNYYEIYRSDTGGNPEMLIEKTAIDGDPESEGFQWFDTVPETAGIVYTYRARAIDGAGSPSAYSTPMQIDLLECQGLSAAEEEIPGLPVNLKLELAQPNPFTGETRLAFALATPQQVSLRIFDARGRIVTTVVQGFLPAKEHELFWDGSDRAGTSVAPGVYFARLEAGGRVNSTKVILID